MRLHLTAAQYAEIRRYLFAPAERVAFLFTKPGPTASAVHVDLVRLLEDHDYALSARDGVVLADHVRPEIIAAAHRMGHGIAEVHAHNWQGPTTQFSRTDLHGLQELGPHMTWRLPDRPYIAVVLGPDSLDALIWHERDRVTGLDSVVVDHRELQPTHLSGRHLKDLASERWSDAR